MWTYGGKPEVFFSLVSQTWLTCGAQARKFLPPALFFMRRGPSAESHRLAAVPLFIQPGRATPAQFRGRFLSPDRQGFGSTCRPKGSIEHWFTERYCLYSIHCNQSLPL